MSLPRETFLAYLREKGLALTPQRAVIAETFLKSTGHFSMEELHARVRQADPSIGQATVYRTLKLLVDSGLARELSTGEGAKLYEHDLGQGHHDHLICLGCGRKVEIVDPEIERLQVDLARAHGFELTRHTMLLFGICPACGRRK